MIYRTAELITTGTELLNGSRLNTHAQTLAQKLEPLGITLERDTTLRDSGPLITELLQACAKRVDLVFISGGLGPTSDDVTAAATADAVGKDLVIDPDYLEVVRQRYLASNRELTPDRIKQAQIVEGAEVLLNPVGIAPGQKIITDEATFIVLPGPPREFHGILDAHVIPFLKANCPGEQEERVLMVTGTGESEIERLIKEHAFAPEGVEIGYCASPGSVEVRLNAAQGSTTIDEASAALQQIFGTNVYATTRLGLMEHIAGQLTAKGKRVSVGESCTGGMLGSMLTALSGSSAYFVGGVLAYCNEVKIAELQVPIKTLEANGAVSEEVALAMAEGARAKFDTDFGLGITGVAGPGGGTEEKPVGRVCIALAARDPDQSCVATHTFPGDREQVRIFSCMRALSLLRLAVEAS